MDGDKKIEGAEAIREVNKLLSGRTIVLVRHDFEAGMIEILLDDSHYLIIPSNMMAIAERKD